MLGVAAFSLLDAGWAREEDSGLVSERLEGDRGIRQTERSWGNCADGRVRVVLKRCQSIERVHPEIFCREQRQLLCLPHDAVQDRNLRRPTPPEGNSTGAF